MTDPLVLVDHVSRRYGVRTAVEDLSLTLPRHGVLGLLGVNGAGKSTVLKLLAGVLAPERGSIRIAGVDLREQPEAARRLIGYLPEQAPCYGELSVLEHLRFAAALRGLARPTRRAAIERVLERCELGAVARRLAAALSKGYQQRLGLAQALLHAPPLLLLDEPSAGLDPVQARRFRELVGALKNECAIVLSTHQLGEVTACCDRVAILHEGRLREDVSLGGLGGDTLEQRFLRVALAAAA
jgi:ABC-2 type transport system ATP-binding protein